MRHRAYGRARRVEHDPIENVHFETGGTTADRCRALFEANRADVTAAFAACTAMVHPDQVVGFVCEGDEPFFITRARLRARDPALARIALDEEALHRGLLPFVFGFDDGTYAVIWMTAVPLGKGGTS